MTPSPSDTPSLRTREGMAFTDCAVGRWSSRRLGSRLYYEFTEAALSDGVAWERIADSVAVEVRRHGAPAPSNPPPTAVGAVAVEAAASASPPPAKMVAAVASATVPVREYAAPGAGVGSVHTTVKNDYSNNVNVNKNYYSKINNSGNSSTLVFM